MKRFNTILLASMIAASSSAFALESMQDEAMSDTTGQDGVTLGVTLPVGGLSWSTVLHDADGFVSSTATTSTTAGAIVIGDPTNIGGITKTSITATNEIPILIDATGDIDSAVGNVTPSLRISITLPAGGLTIHTGDLSVARSTGLGNAIANKSATILSDMTVVLGAGTTVNMYLGGESVTVADLIGKNMIELNTTISNGITISNFSLNDTVAGGSIFASQIKLCDTNAASTCTATGQLGAVINGNVLSGANGGLAFTIGRLGTASGMDVEVTGFRLGSAATTAIGNVDIVGLNVANTVLRIAGH